MEPLDALERSVAQTRPVVAATTPRHYDLPTPCDEWDVRALLDHLLGVVAMFRDLPGGEPDLGALGGTHVGEDPGAAYDRLTESALAAWRADGVVEGMVRFPGSELPGGFAARMLAGDVVMHGWDLARATDQAVDWDQELAADSLDWHHEAIRLFPPELRAQGFAPPVPVPDDADTMTRLVGLVGRNP